MFLSDSKNTHFKADITTVCVDLRSRTSMPIPDYIKTFLQEYLN